MWSAETGGIGVMPDMASGKERILASEILASENEQHACAS